MNPQPAKDASSRRYPANVATATVGGLSSHVATFQKPVRPPCMAFKRLNFSEVLEVSRAARDESTGHEAARHGRRALLDGLAIQRPAYRAGGQLLVGPAGFHPGQS